MCSLAPDPAALGGEVTSNTLSEVLVPRNSRVSISFLYGSFLFFVLRMRVEVGGGRNKM